MKDIAIFGVGGFGREVLTLIQDINKVEPTWNVIGFFDDGYEIGYPGKIVITLLNGIIRVLHRSNGASLLIMAKALI